MAKLELYGTASCPYTEELREWLEWTRRDFLEYDIEADPEARERLRSLDSSLLHGSHSCRGWQGDPGRMARPRLRCRVEVVMATACSIRVRGVVQGVGFRPFVYRLAQANMLTGWVLNGDQGVEIHLEGAEEDLAAFVREMQTRPPAAARIAEIEVESAPCEGLSDFTIRESERLDRPTVRVSPDLPICDECLAELFDPSDRRYGYPYINCTNCGPRYSVILALPYDRPNTTMRRLANGSLLQP